ncbi:P-loop containing nucleoside triphosphate hydrolase protein [Schizopora paradoxa]|uniref:p-loop containing nucleoside triphosphate hydrolase protein n=1 Tax=Schizopora paradoxa TaxID=27342 RepID=A0A0H2RVM6_9AGAM|nr:P-loop containing nucleoside triphosphate hydrolase protein [Schizopora paradoxa]
MQSDTTPPSAITESSLENRGKDIDPKDSESGIDEPNLEAGPTASISDLTFDAQSSLSDTKQIYMDCKDEEAKYGVLVRVCKLIGETQKQSIIYIQSRQAAIRIAEMLSQEGHKTALVHSGQPFADRDHTIFSFRRGDTSILVITNIEGRVFDNIIHVNIMVHFDLPVSRNMSERLPLDKLDFTTYMQRMGRAGRFGRNAIMINFAHDEKSRQYIHEAEEIVLSKMDRISAVDGDTMDEDLKKALRHIS